MIGPVFIVPLMPSMNPMLKLIKKNFSISAEILFFVHKEFRFLSFIEVGNFDCQAQRLNWVLIESSPPHTLPFLVLNERYNKIRLFYSSAKAKALILLQSITDFGFKLICYMFCFHSIYCIRTSLG